jgi:hypothetical protein
MWHITPGRVLRGYHMVTAENKGNSERARWRVRLPGLAQEIEFPLLLGMSNVY